MWITKFTQDNSRLLIPFECSLFKSKSNPLHAIQDSDFKCFKVSEHATGVLFCHCIFRLFLKGSLCQKNYSGIIYPHVTAKLFTFFFLNTKPDILDNVKVEPFHAFTVNEHRSFPGFKIDVKRTLIVDYSIIGVRIRIHFKLSSFSKMLKIHLFGTEVVMQVQFVN